MSKIKAVIFDLDGTIIDSERLWTEADLVFLTTEGINVEKPDYEKNIKPLLMGAEYTEGVRVFKKRLGLKGSTKTLLRKRRAFVDKFLENVVHVEGFREFHKKVKKTHKIAIATALERYFLDPIVLRFQLMELFNGHIYSIEDIGFIPKPNPDIYLHAAAKLGLNPSECVGIEDSVKGVEAINRAGMKSIAITTSTSRDRLTHADIIVDSFSEIDVEKL